MEIWEEIRKNSDCGAERLVSEYGNRLYAAALLLCSNGQDAEDLTFRTLNQAIRKIKTFDPSRSFYIWIYTIMLNFRRMDLRRKRMNVISVGSTTDLPEVAINSFAEMLDNSEDDHLTKAIASLSPQLREVTKIEKVAFPLIVLTLCATLLPSAVPLIGALMLGNLAKEVGASVGRISDTMSNALINIVTIMLGLSVGSKLACEKFLSGQTLAILGLGLCAFCVGTAGGVLMAKLMNLFCRKENRINPLIGSAGVSAVPMAARVSNKISLENDSTNYILMQAMGPNVSGVIGSAVVAGVLYTLCR